MLEYTWTGPFRIADLLARSTDNTQPMPPEADGVYVITRKPWTGTPARACEPLYVGGNTGKSKRFRTRIGDLIADLHGFMGDETGHHSGGYSLHAWCRREGVPPGDLYIAWATGEPWCDRCAEVEIAKMVAPDWSNRAPLLNSRRPRRCSIHAR